MQNGTDLYALDIDGASFVKACGGPCTEGCVTLARIGEDAWALGDSKRPGTEPLRFTTEELDAAGIDRNGTNSCTTTAICGPARRRASTTRPYGDPRTRSHLPPEASRN